jgi:hypothetical protein
MPDDGHIRMMKEMDEQIVRLKDTLYKTSRELKWTWTLLIASILLTAWTGLFLWIGGQELKILYVMFGGQCAIGLGYVIMHYYDKWRNSNGR